MTLGKKGNSRRAAKLDRHVGVGRNLLALLIIFSIYRFRWQGAGIA